MKYIKIILLSLVLLNLSNYSYATVIYFIDMKKILNTSKAGKGAQDYLKNKLKEETSKFDKKQENLKKKKVNLSDKKN